MATDLEGVSLASDHDAPEVASEGSDDMKVGPGIAKLGVSKVFYSPSLAWDGHRTTPHPCCLP